MSKTTGYIIAIIVLLGANLLLFFGKETSTTKNAENYFQVEDLERVSRFTFSMNGDSTVIERAGEEWKLNAKYKADEGFVNTLISILERVEAGRTIENWDRETLGNVEVEFDFNSRYRFEIGTNATKTKSYFIANGEAKEVAVPGYRDNVVDIFLLHPDQWRDRNILDGSWRTIQRLTVENKQAEDFEISFNDSFFLVNGTTPTDSSAVVSYLNQFQQFQANEMISEGRFPALDSLSYTEPLAIVTIDDIKYDSPVRLEIFPNLVGQPYHLVRMQTGERMVIDARRVAQILTNPDN
ncbi:MAG: DUF4340 domain-containing protein [Ekhidna sp.]|uniref:DUF4340 domain-containing protein n=1 Tax=Ekhidna sp. TaxID=2608089 RepID=UPI0032EC345E